MSGKLAKLGLAAVLAYGLFDGVTYTTFFVLAFLGYEKSTDNNPAANIKALIGIVLLMWTGNNVTRPFRVAGAAALAPAIDKGPKRSQLAKPRLCFRPCGRRGCYLLCYCCRLAHSFKMVIIGLIQNSFTSVIQLGKCSYGFMYTLWMLFESVFPNGDTVI